MGSLVYLSPEPKALCPRLKRHMATTLILRGMDAIIETTQSQGSVTTLKICVWHLRATEGRPLRCLSGSEVAGFVLTGRSYFNSGRLRQGLRRPPVPPLRRPWRGRRPP